jgi:hypothetical protein
MTVFEILRDIQEARARVELWGVNVRMLAIIAGVAFIVFMISLREILAWYLKINALRRELRELREELAEQRARYR